MTRRIVLALCIGFAATFAAAQPTGLPKTAAPKFVAVAGFDPVAGTVKFVEQDLVPKVEKRQVKVFTGTDPIARVVEQDVTVYVPVAKIAERKLADYSLQTADGLPVAPDKALALFQESRLVLVAQDGQPIDPAYLKLIDKATLIFNPKKGTP